MGEFGRAGEILDRAPYRIGGKRRRRVPVDPRLASGGTDAPLMAGIAPRVQQLHADTGIGSAHRFDDRAVPLGVPPGGQPRGLGIHSSLGIG